MYSKILVPVDLAHPGSARHTIGVAKALAETGKSSLILLNVVPDVPGYVAAELPADHARNIRARATAELDDMAGEFGLKQSAKTMVTRRPAA